MNKKNNKIKLISSIIASSILITGAIATPLIIKKSNINNTNTTLFGFKNSTKANPNYNPDPTVANLFTEKQFNAFVRGLTDPKNNEHIHKEPSLSNPDITVEQRSKNVYSDIKVEGKYFTFTWTNNQQQIKQSETTIKTKWSYPIDPESYSKTHVNYKWTFIEQHGPLSDPTIPGTGEVAIPNKEYTISRPKDEVIEKLDLMYKNALQATPTIDEIKNNITPLIEAEVKKSTTGYTEAIVSALKNKEMTDIYPDKWKQEVNNLNDNDINVTLEFMLPDIKIKTLGVTGNNLEGFPQITDITINVEKQPTQQIADIVIPYSDAKFEAIFTPDQSKFMTDWEALNDKTSLQKKLMTYINDHIDEFVTNPYVQGDQKTEATAVALVKGQDDNTYVANVTFKNWLEATDGSLNSTKRVDNLVKFTLKADPAGADLKAAIEPKVQEWVSTLTILTDFETNLKNKLVEIVNSTPEIKALMPQQWTNNLSNANITLTVSPISLPTITVADVKLNNQVEGSKFNLDLTSEIKATTINPLTITADDIKTAFNNKLTGFTVDVKAALNANSGTELKNGIKTFINTKLTELISNPSTVPSSETAIGDITIEQDPANENSFIVKATINNKVNAQGILENSATPEQIATIQTVASPTADVIKPLLEQGLQTWALGLKNTNDVLNSFKQAIFDLITNSAEIKAQMPLAWVGALDTKEKVVATIDSANIQLPTLNFTGVSIQNADGFPQGLDISFNVNIQASDGADFAINPELLTTILGENKNYEADFNPLIADQATLDSFKNYINNASNIDNFIKNKSTDENKPTSVSTITITAKANTPNTYELKGTVENFVKSNGEAGQQSDVLLATITTKPNPEVNAIVEGIKPTMDEWASTFKAIPTDFETQFKTKLAEVLKDSTILPAAWKANITDASSITCTVPTTLTTGSKDITVTGITIKGMPNFDITITLSNVNPTTANTSNNTIDANSEIFKTIFANNQKVTSFGSDFQAQFTADKVGLETALKDYINKNINQFVNNPYSDSTTKAAGIQTQANTVTITETTAKSVYTVTVEFSNWVEENGTLAATKQVNDFLRINNFKKDPTTADVQADLEKTLSAFLTKDKTPDQIKEYVVKNINQLAQKGIIPQSWVAAEITPDKITVTQTNTQTGEVNVEVNLDGVLNTGWASNTLNYNATPLPTSSSTVDNNVIILAIVFSLVTLGLIAIIAALAVRLKKEKDDAAEAKKQ